MVHEKWTVGRLRKCAVDGLELPRSSLDWQEALDPNLSVAVTPTPPQMSRCALVYAQPAHQAHGLSVIDHDVGLTSVLAGNHQRVTITSTFLGKDQGHHHRPILERMQITFWAIKMLQVIVWITVNSTVKHPNQNIVIIRADEDQW